MPKASPNLKRLRRQVGLSQNKLANRAGISRNHISRAEQNMEVSVESLDSIVAVLGWLSRTPTTLSDVLDIGNLTDERKLTVGLMSQIEKRMMDTGGTWETLASATLIKKDTLQNFRTGEASPSKEQIETLAETFGVSNEELWSNYRPRTSVRGPQTSFSFNDELRVWLREKEMTTSELSNQISISEKTIRNWLSGSTPPRNKKTLSKIIEALQLDGDALERWLNRDHNPPEIEEQTARKRNLQQVAREIPDQNSLVRFGISENAKLNLVPTLGDENDYDTIEALRSELLAPQGPVEHLKERYAKNPNVPQAGLFGPLTSKYHEELSKDPREINYTVLFARGSRFYAARRRAAQQIASQEWPDLDADENEAIDAICDLHGPMIMASAAGRKLVEDAHQYEVPPDVYEEDQRTIEEFGQVIAAETELIEPETAEAYRELTTKTEGDPQPARSRGLGIAATGSALTVIVGGAAWYGAGGAVATFIVPAAAIGTAGLVGGFFWEAIKTMPRFKKATTTVGDQFEKALDKAEKHADDKERALLKGMADLVERKRPLFERVANMRPEFGWAKKFLSGPNDKADDLIGRLTQHIILVGGRTEEKVKIGSYLAERLMVPFRSLEMEVTELITDNPNSYRERVGDNAFLERTRQSLDKLLHDAPCVIELGLTFFEYRELWQFISDRAYVIWISANENESRFDFGNPLDRESMINSKIAFKLMARDAMDFDDAADGIVKQLRSSGLFS